MRKRWRGILIVLLIIGGTFFFLPSPSPPTEKFVKENFIKQNGEITTYIESNELLTESIGLYMQYLLLTNRREAFQQQVEIVNQLIRDGFIPWRDENAYSNALVDDLRIMKSLYEAANLWNAEEYHALAVEIRNFIKKNQMNDHLIVDFFDIKSEKASRELHLSYIDAEALRYFSEETLKKHTNLLEQVKSNTFFPEVYNLKMDNFQSQQEVNMIDQSLIALNANRLGIATENFSRFIEEEFENRGKILGRYDRESKVPTVEYESPSAYALLILFFLNNKEEEKAEKLFNRMKQFRDQDGGYKTSDSNAHFFDNILPLIAEHRLNKS